MQISEKWLRTLVDPDLSTEELVHLLTMSGLEVEECHALAPAFSGVVVGRVLETGKHPNAGRLFVHFMAVGEGLRVYCKLNSTGQSILDPDGKKSGCQPLGEKPLFLTIDPVSDADSEVVIRELKLP